MTDLTQKIADLVFKDVPMYEPGESQQAHHAPWGSITVVDRMTGSGWRDVETGFCDPDGLFSLTAGSFDIRDFPDLSISEAIGLIKKKKKRKHLHRIPPERRTSTTTTTQEEN